MKPITRLFAATLIAASLSPAVALADDDAERQTLAVISNEIARVRALVEEAARTAPTSGRVRFQYPWLAEDLRLIQDGVDSHVDAPRQPRPVAPLRGDYRR